MWGVSFFSQSCQDFFRSLYELIIFDEFEKCFCFHSISFFYFVLVFFIFLTL